jgi:hypothetical protein
MILWGDSSFYAMELWSVLVLCGLAFLRRLASGGKLTFVSFRARHGLSS